MLRLPKKITHSDIIKSNRFDAKYYYLGQKIDFVLQNYKTQKCSKFSNFIKKGIFDLSASYYTNKGVPFIRISNMRLFTINEKGLVYIPLEKHVKELKTRLIHGDLVLSKIGKYLGKISQIPKRFDEVNISQNIVGVSVKKDNNEDLINSKYLFLYLTTKLAITQIIRASKVHNQPKLTLPDIRELPIPMLSHERREYYANISDKLADFDDKSYLQIQEAKQLFYDRLNFSESHNGKSKSFTINFSQICEESFWTPQYSNPIYNEYIDKLKKYNPAPLYDFVDDYKGDEVGSDNYKLYSSKDDYDIPFIRTSDIVNHEIDLFPDFFVSPDILNNLKQEIKPNDIIFSKDGSIGHVALVTSADEAIICGGFSILRMKKKSKIDPFYLLGALSIPEIGECQALKRTVVASTIPHIRPQNVMKILIPILHRKDRDKISSLIRNSFLLKTKRKQLLLSAKEELEREISE
jgi:type I restriction enzyme S subunit